MAAFTRCALVALCAMTGALAVPFEYGPCMDRSVTDQAEPAWVSLDLPVPFVMKGVGYSNLKVSTNGVISLAGALASHSPSSGLAAPFIAPLWQDQSLGDGVLLLRTSQDQDDLHKVRDMLAELDWEFDPVAIGIVTWSGIESLDGSDNTNTYQAVLATDGVSESYVLNFYMELAFSDPSALCGFNQADGTFTPTRFLGADMKYLHLHTNSRTVGRFVYKTSGNTVEAPAGVTPVERCTVNSEGVYTRRVGADSSVGSFSGQTIFKSAINQTDPCKYKIKLSNNGVGISQVSFNVGIHPKNSKKYYRNVVMDTQSPGQITERGQGIKAHAETTPYLWESADGASDIYVEGDASTGWLVYSSQCPWQMVYTPGAHDNELQLTTTSNPHYANPATGGLCV